jgi:hypothetical protein
VCMSSSLSTVPVGRSSTPYIRSTSSAFARREGATIRCRDTLPRVTKKARERDLRGPAQLEREVRAIATERERDRPRERYDQDDWREPLGERREGSFVLFKPDGHQDLTFADADESLEDALAEAEELVPGCTRTRITGDRTAELYGEDGTWHLVRWGSDKSGKIYHCVERAPRLGERGPTYGCSLSYGEASDALRRGQARGMTGLQIVQRRTAVRGIRGWLPPCDER